MLDGSHGGALPPRYLEDPGIPESLQVCVTFVPFALFHPEKNPSNFGRNSTWGCHFMFFTKRVSGTCNHPRIKMVVPIR